MSSTYTITALNGDELVLSEEFVSSFLERHLAMYFSDRWSGTRLQRESIVDMVIGTARARVRETSPSAEIRTHPTDKALPYAVQWLYGKYASRMSAVPGDRWYRTEVEAWLVAFNVTVLVDEES